MEERLQLLPASLQVPTIVYSLGLCRFRHDKLLEELAGRMTRDTQLLHSFTPQGLSNTLLGLANLAYRHPPTLTVLLRAMAAKQNELEPRHFCNAIYALGKLYHIDDIFLESCAAAMVRRNIPQQLSQQGLAITLYGLGALLEDTAWDAASEARLHKDLDSDLHAQVRSQIRQLPRALP